MHILSCVFAEMFPGVSIAFCSSVTSENGISTADAFNLRTKSRSAAKGEIYAAPFRAAWYSSNSTESKT
jgi:hypothetical protein